MCFAQLSLLSSELAIMVNGTTKISAPSANTLWPDFIITLAFFMFFRHSIKLTLIMKGVDGQSTSFFHCKYLYQFQIEQQLYLLLWNINWQKLVLVCLQVLGHCLETRPLELFVLQYFALFTVSHRVLELLGLISLQKFLHLFLWKNSFITLFEPLITSQVSVKDVVLALHFFNRHALLLNLFLMWVGGLIFLFFFYSFLSSKGAILTTISISLASNEVQQDGTSSKLRS